MNQYAVGKISNCQPGWLRGELWVTFFCTPSRLRSKRKREGEMGEGGDERKAEEGGWGGGKEGRNAKPLV